MIASLGWVFSKVKFHQIWHNSQYSIESPSSPIACNISLAHKRKVFCCPFSHNSLTICILAMMFVKVQHSSVINTYYVCVHVSYSVNSTSQYNVKLYLRLISLLLFCICFVCTSPVRKLTQVLNQLKY